jgi:hypothetical protein
MIWLSIVLGVTLSFVTGVWLGSQKLFGAAVACWLGGAFYAGYMLCLALNL